MTILFLIYIDLFCRENLTSAAEQLALSKVAIVSRTYVSRVHHFSLSHPTAVRRPSYRIRGLGPSFHAGPVRIDQTHHLNYFVGLCRFPHDIITNFWFTVSQPVKMLRINRQVSNYCFLHTTHTHTHSISS